jgi:hypothetical protein
MTARAAVMALQRLRPFAVGRRTATNGHFADAQSADASCGWGQFTFSFL